MKNKIIKLFQDPWYIAERIIEKYFSRYMSDRSYLRLLHFVIFRRRLNLDQPKTFNEKLAWLKLYDRKDIYTVMADKYAVKQHVRDLAGGGYVVDNHCVAERWSDIDFDKLPEQFVIKCTHDSGGAFVCKNKDKFNFDDVKKQVCGNLRRNYFTPYREWPYKNIRPRIIVDKYLDDGTGCELRDYKFLCFEGTPKFMYCTIKGKNVFENFYDMDFKPVYIDHGFPRRIPEFEKPQAFEEMKHLVEKLAKGIPFVRVDLFYVNGRVYFGEYTFYDWAGLRPFKSNWDNILGEMIKLPSKL